MIWMKFEFCQSTTIRNFFLIKKNCDIEKLEKVSKNKLQN
jgi:hypothetical protein